MKQLYYYSRQVMRRVPINSYGRLGYKPYVELIALEHEEELTAFNFHKQIKFTPTSKKLFENYVTTPYYPKRLYAYVINRN